jgi:hypothetical protein
MLQISLLFGLASGVAKLKIQNNCDFGVKPYIEGTGTVNTLAKGETASIEASQLITGSRNMYFGPSDYMSDAVNRGYLGNVRVTSNGSSLKVEPTYENYFGLPMLLEHISQDSVIRRSGCSSMNYEGFESFQKRLKNYCPGVVERLDSEIEMYYCTAPTDNTIEGTEVDETWDVNATKSVTNVSETCPAVGYGNQAKVNIQKCQPTECMTDDTCAELNRGTTATVDDAGDTFYSEPEPYNPNKDDIQWRFNPYPAFVHLICGQKIMAFPADEDGYSGAFTANGQNGEEEQAVITLCPVAGQEPNSPGVLPPSSDKGLPWWAWFLIAIAIAIALGLLIWLIVYLMQRNRSPPKAATKRKGHGPKTKRTTSSPSGANKKNIRKLPSRGKKTSSRPNRSRGDSKRNSPNAERDRQRRQARRT